MTTQKERLSKQIVRALTIFEVLTNESPMRIGQIYDWLANDARFQGCCLRTLRRDLDALEVAGYIEAQERQGGRVYQLVDAQLRVIRRITKPKKPLTPEASQRLNQLKASATQ